MSRLPLRLRLTLAFAIAMAVVLSILGAFLYVQLRSTLDEQLDQSLRARAAAAESLRPGFRTGDEDSYVRVLDGSGEPIASESELQRARRAPDGIFLERDSEPGIEEGPVRLLVWPGDTGVVVAAASLEERNEALGSLLSQLAIGGPVALLLASLAGYALAGATLRPVESMRRRAAEISGTVEGRRLPQPEGDDEIARLARTLNDMLARLEAGLERERRFAAEASHELRTPLASLKAELELALRRPRSAEELRAAIASAAEETDRLAALAEDLLVLARSDEGELKLDEQAVPARRLLETVARRFAARAEDAGVALDVDAPEALAARGDVARLEQALGNLVDNALRYGAGTIRLAASGQDGSVLLSVTDEGQGFAEDFLPRAFERFSRPDGARASDAAGLGLAIVEAIVRAHGGSVTAANAEGGGAEVTLRLSREP
jgi:two-component system, OmpR family, sensor kinase